MKNNILLVAINAKYIHSNLAVRYIEKYCENSKAHFSIAEFSINDQLNHILKEIYSRNADVIAFSCYIWNLELILKLSSSLKKIKPGVTILLGGPEVSYDAVPLLNRHAYIDMIIIGEGEETFLEFANEMTNPHFNLKNIAGIAYRDNEHIHQTIPRKPLQCLDDIPFPYSDLDLFHNKIIYYETSRGCPFSCQYCLSSTTQGVRHLSLERIKSDIQFFIQNKVRQVKLVDRTFNCNKKLCVEILQFILDQNGQTNFHFEVAADLIDDDFLKTVALAPPEIFQFEIGVQSTNTETLKAIKRLMDFEKVSQNVSQLLSYNNAHLHLDLIAGLPYEGFESFKTSFNAVYALNPHMLQLGFLKLLKGSGLRASADLYEIQFQAHGPYEVLSTKWLSYQELLKLKDVEHLVEIYYNSGKFKNALAYLLSNSPILPFDFYYRFSQYWNEKGYYHSPKGVNELYTILYDYAALNGDVSLQFNEMLKLDWLLYCKSGSMPGVIKRVDASPLKDTIYAYIKNNEQLMHYMQMSDTKTVKDLLKKLYYEIFFYDISKQDFTLADTLVLFLPDLKNPAKIEYFSVAVSNL